tara:strand:+ start:6190 stop:6762 length:573 start_codon:yes stop_codon:yes gene_type:complete
VNYKKYLVYVDLFGIFAVISTVFYIYSDQLFSNIPEKFSGVWGNLSTELIGIWFGVRLIDWIIKSNDKSTNNRIVTLRNMRFLTKQAERVIEFGYRHDSKILNKEVNWFKTVMSQRARFFSRDELQDINNYIDSLTDFLMQVNSVISPSSGDVQLKLAEHIEEKFFSLIENIDELRLIAEANILEETPEE